MAKIFGYITVILLLVAMTTACSSYKKMRNSTTTNENKDFMYDKAMKAFKAKKYQKAIPVFEEVAPFFIGTVREDSISYYTGLCYYKTGDFESSGTIFDDFRRRFGRSPFVEDAEYMYALGYYYAAPPANRDQSVSMRAIVAINEYMSRYPKSEKKEFLESCIDELSHKLDHKAFMNAKSYYTTGRYKSAVMALKNTLVKYPDTNHREELLYLTAKSAYLLAINSVEHLQKDRYLAMLDDYYNFISEFPESKFRKETDKMAENAKKGIAKTTKITEAKERKAEVKEIRKENKELTKETKEPKVKKEKKEKKTEEK